MAIIPITVYGDKILRQKAQPVKQVTDELIVKIKNMLDSMHNANGVGLAANQVGYRESIFVIDLKGVEGYKDFKPVVMINPEILLESDEKIIYEEGCLSLPTLRADVERAEEIKVKYIDTDEKEKEIDADDFFARVILHEYDHLIGKMIPDRVAADIKKKLQGDLTKIMNREVEIDYEITEK
ncbi:MAG: peptide deformylase [Ignavibacteriales bacterium]|nr:peptide deformylase [Ignavibacteriales bacterium]OGU69221.1 MAG: peptide deformylase [Stygiobacter sp. GWC2_38_9]OGU77971.1 MAG: peptide deformylase [Stygiobacter sp. RIFOXYA12_FULL_38_9]OGV06716.1 MAG: peptide deformylase [Stygiobacter sp. RIFOXYB2_FULL_37_11]OGV10365.1 MAG: peptide deformylase [Stygiobacter sp. RIFOXYA2_FULL_38_8]OGV15099.1 MAG: peptide deformylase [Stygiobacter sp. RIFOXYC2_FULL_38_25]OGV23030.1 MAG: peptide deformylase [Stygiobacter sp. RIFOXYC12_FULL_38_8]OGV79674.1 